MTRKRDKQRCDLCEKPSLRGFASGFRRCQYHWNVYAYGLAWADKIEAGKNNKRHDPEEQTP